MIGKSFFFIHSAVLLSNQSPHSPGTSPSSGPGDTKQSSPQQGCSVHGVPPRQDMPLQEPFLQNLSRTQWDPVVLITFLSGRCREGVNAVIKIIHKTNSILTVTWKIGADNVITVMIFFVPCKKLLEFCLPMHYRLIAGVPQEVRRPIVVKPLLM